MAEEKEISNKIEELKERVRALDKWKDEPVEPTDEEKRQIRRRSNPASDAENRLGFMKASRTWERALQTIPRMIRKLESKIAEAERHVREGNDDEAEKIRWEVYTECLDFENSFRDEKCGSAPFSARPFGDTKPDSVC